MRRIILIVMWALGLWAIAATAQQVTSGPSACEAELSRERAYSTWVSDLRNRTEYNLDLLSRRYQDVVRERDTLKKELKPDAPKSE